MVAQLYLNFCEKCREHTRRFFFGFDGGGQNVVHAPEIERAEMAHLGPQQEVRGAYLKLCLQDGAKRDLLRAKQRLRRARTRFVALGPPLTSTAMTKSA